MSKPLQALQTRPEGDYDPCPDSRGWQSYLREILIQEYQGVGVEDYSLNFLLGVAWRWFWSSRMSAPVS